MPNNTVSKALLNSMFNRVGCSIGDLTVNASRDTMRVPITCRDEDIRVVEKILKTYGIIGENKNE